MAETPRRLGMKWVSGAVAASGANTASIAAPGVGRQIVITKIFLARTDATSTTITLLANTDATGIVIVTSDYTTGFFLDLRPEEAIELGSNKGFVFSLSAANPIRFVVQYYIESCPV